MIAWSNTMIKFVALPLLRKALAIRYSPIIVLYQTFYLSEKLYKMPRFMLIEIKFLHLKPL